MRWKKCDDLVFILKGMSFQMIPTAPRKWEHCKGRRVHEAQLKQYLSAAWNSPRSHVCDQIIQPWRISVLEDFCYPYHPASTNTLWNPSAGHWRMLIYYYPYHPSTPSPIWPVIALDSLTSWANQEVACCGSIPPPCKTKCLKYEILDLPASHLRTPAHFHPQHKPESGPQDQGRK